MKLKQIIFALVAILSSFSVSVWAQTTVTAAAELTEALANGGEVTLGADITVNETQTIPAGVSVTLDLNGKTVSQSKACVASYEMILNKGNLTIKNGTIRFTDTSEGDPTFGWGSYTVRNEGTLVVEDDATIEHLGKQAFATHMICAIFQYSGSTTINGGKISTPNYRSIRLWKGDMTINGGTFDGQLWVQAVDNSAKLTINAGTFEPNGNDASSVFVGNDKYDVEFAVAGGTFNGKIGCSDATKLAGAISGGKFNEGAKSGTNSTLLASGFIFGEAGTDGYSAVEDAPATHYIATLEDLKALRDAVNSGTNYYAGVNVYLTADIDLAGENWVGIGSATAEHGFMGNFDGKGYTIKNLTITDPALDSDGYAYAGLFAVTEGTDKDNQNTIKNLTIENVTINTTGHIVSAAIAYPYYTIVDNIKVCGDIKIQGGNYTAGVLAYTRRCVNASNLSIVGEESSFVTGNQTVGGVISDIQMNGGLTAVYKNFSAQYLSISGTKQVGGISGIISQQTLDGATVKKVALNCSDARVGIVAGCLGGISTISNVTYENVTGATATIGATYDDAKAVEARIGNMYYATFADAYAAAKEGETVSMLADLNMSEILVLDKAITLDGNGKTLTSTAGRAINVSGADGVTIKNLTINASGERAINIIQNATNVTIDNVTATAANYTVNVASSAPKAVVTIKNSTLNGLCTVNVSAAGANVTVDNSTVNCNDNNTTAGESYAALSLNKEAVGGSIVATSTTVNVAAGSDSMKGRNGAENGTVTINGSTDGVAVMVAVITYPNSDNYHAFATLDAAIDFAKAGDAITLIRDITASGIITINKAITLDGNDKKLTSTAGRAINVSGADGVTIKNLTINASGERAINIIQNATNVTIDNVTATAANYTVNVASSAPNAKVAVNNSSLTGLNVVNVASPGADVTITNGTITCNDQNASENYAALVLHKDGKNATIAATGVTFDIKGDSKKASNGAVGGVITIDGKTDEVDVVVAYISYGDNSYTFTSIEAAIAAAKEGETITMLAPVVIAAGETLTLDKNITIAYTSNVAGEDMFTNRGTLNISAGTITYVNTDATGSNVTVSTISSEPGSVLNITGGTVENKTVKADGSSIYSYAIDMLTNGNLGDVTATIEGGTVYSDYMAIRQFNNGDACKNTLNITGGYIYGAKRAVQVHFKNNAAYTTISGGKIEAGAADGYSLCFLTTSENLSVSGGEFIGAVWYSGSKGFISGGTFASEIDAAYCAEGFACQQNADGTFGIVKANAGLSGAGTEESPYLIQSVADLVLFRNSVNAGETKYSAPGVWVALAADIDLASENWVGIGSATAEHGFMGNFDGKIFKFKNLTITDPALDSDGYAYAGLFAVTEGIDKDNQNTIKNLTIENVTINTTGHIVSAAIAYPYYTIVDNIKVCGDININGGNYTAGVLAYTRRCVNASNLSIVGKEGSFVTGNQTVGGVISDIQMNGGLVADYKYFSAEGLAITGAMHVGGISGIISGQTLTGATVKNVNLTCTDARVGLVAGSLGDASAISDVVTENVTGATALIGAGYKSAKAVEAKIGNKYFTTLEDALAAEGNKVELLVPYVVAADDEIVLDLKGKTVTGTPSEAKAYSAITNNGNLTIINGTLLCNHELTGSTGYAVNTITNCGILTIEGATIQNTSTASNQIGYAIDNNSTSTNAIVTINSGNVVASGSNYYDGIRQFCNSLTKDNSVIVKGGEVSSIWMQNPSDGAEKNTKDVKGSISISGGTVNILSLEPSTNFQAAVTGGHVGEISYFQEAEGRNLVKFITGGTFGMDVTKFCADYHNCTSNENGVYEVKPDANYIAEYIIDDAKGEDYTSAEEKVVGTLTYKRTLPDVMNWNPLYVPFAIPMSMLIENYDVAYFNDVHGYDNDNNGVLDRTTIELVQIKNENATLKANYPYIIRAKSEDAQPMDLVLNNVTLCKAFEKTIDFTSLLYKYEVKGSYQTLTSLEDNQRIMGEGQWGTLMTGYSLKPYRLVMTITSREEDSPVSVVGEVRMRVIGEEIENGVTHIYEIKGDDSANECIYDLQGRRLQNLQKGGLYIVNGKKVVIK